MGEEVGEEELHVGEKQNVREEDSDSSEAEAKNGVREGDKW